MTESPRRRPGAKSKRTPETQAKLIEALKLGATNVIACQYAGIAETTFYAWMAENVEFSQSIEKARAYAAVDALRTIQKARREGQWQSAAWLLERRYPHEYGRRTVQMEVTGKLDLNVLVKQIAALDDDQLEALIEGKTDVLPSAQGKGDEE